MLRQWQGVEYGVTGDDAAMATVRHFVSAFPAMAFEELRVEAGIELAEAGRRAPIDVDPPKGRTGGELRESARLINVSTDDGMGVALAFGGPTVPYAIAQHQRYYRHDVGQREYLIDTIDQSKRFIGARLARRLERRLPQAVQVAA